MRDLEFRFQVTTWAIMNFLWFGLMLASVNLIFGQVEAIAGWSKDKVLLLVFVQALFFDFLWTFFLINLRKFSRLVRHGELDLVLLKPVSPRFFVSTRYFDNDHYPRMLVILFLIPGLLKTLQVQPALFAWLNAALLFILGLFIFYNLFFIITTTNFWFTNLFNLGDLCSEMVDVGRAPVYVFKDKARAFFIYFIPTAFVSTFPTQALLGETGFELVLVGVIISLASFAFSQLFWQFALRRYSSAAG